MKEKSLLWNSKDRVEIDNKKRVIRIGIKNKALVQTLKELISPLHDSKDITLLQWKKIK